MKRLKNLKMTILLMAITGIFGISNVSAMERKQFSSRQRTSRQRNITINTSDQFYLDYLPNNQNNNLQNIQRTITLPNQIDNIQNQINNLQNQINDLRVIQRTLTLPNQNNDIMNNMSNRRPIYLPNQNNDIMNNMPNRRPLSRPNLNNDVRNRMPLNRANLTRNYNNARTDRNNNNDVSDMFSLDNNTRNRMPLNRENLTRNYNNARTDRNNDYNNAQYMIPLAGQRQFGNVKPIFQQQEDKEQRKLREQEYVLWYSKMKQIEKDIKSLDNKNKIKKYIEEAPKDLSKKEGVTEKANRMAYLGVCKAVKVKYEDMLEQYDELRNKFSKYVENLEIEFRLRRTEQQNHKDDAMEQAHTLLERITKSKQAIQDHINNTEISIELVRDENYYFESFYDVFIKDFNDIKSNIDYFMKLI